MLKIKRPSGLSGHNGLKKPLLYESPQYLDYVRTRPCSVPGCCDGPTHAHHVYTGGLSTKCTDIHTIPLCWKHHEELHRIGKESFQERYNFSLEVALIKCLTIYVVISEGRNPDEYIF